MNCSSLNSSKLKVTCKAASRRDVKEEDVREAKPIGAVKVSCVTGYVEQGQALEAFRSSSSDT